MNEVNLVKDVYKEYARIGQALSNGNRVEILNTLSQGSKTVAEISKITNLSVANVSKHLQVLLKSRLVSNKKEKTYVIYRLANKEVHHFLNHFNKLGDQQIKEVQEIKSIFIDEHKDTKAITLEELEKDLSEESIILIDVRPNDEYNYSHIPGAISMPIEMLEKELKQLPKGKQIVAYCRGPYCLMSSDAVELLRKDGRKAVRLIDGVQEWEEFKKTS